jgi:hypothetical protein
LAFFEFNPEEFGSLWLIASATFGGGGGGGNNLAEGLKNLGRRAVPLLNYTVAFALQLGKITENSVSAAEKLETARCVDLGVFLRTASAGLLSISPPRLPVRDFSQPLVGTTAFQVAELRGSLHQLTLKRKSLSVL